MNVEILIIHLARAEQRRPHVEHLLSSMPFPASVVDAIDGRKLNDADIRSNYAQHLHGPYYPFGLTANEIACFLSHRRAWQTIVDRNLDAALIMEDDAAPDAGFEAVLEFALGHIQNSGFIRFPFRSGREAGRQIDSAGAISLLEPRCIGLGMVTQLVSRNAATQLLRATERFDRPVDTMLQMPWVTGVAPHSVTPGAIREISNTLGGTTLVKSSTPLAKLRRELLRPIYRAKVSLWSRLARRPRRSKPSPIRSMPLIAVAEPPPTP